MALSSFANSGFLLVKAIASSGLRRTLHITTTRCGADSREKRMGHIELSDKVEGEFGTFAPSQSSFEFIDEKLMDRVINGMKFKDIPIIYIKSTRNNTKITLVRDGQVLATKSGGTEGYKNCRKGTTVAAQAVAKRAISVATDNEIDTVRMVFNGLGPGRNAAYKVFEMSNMNIVSLSDRSQAAEPWNLRPRKAKRI